ncbi:MFS transporter [Staphylococcus chromogenes]|uniref:MFS transporter n=1 Tax=Staphylococcus chromogenes TaxID=46126 RepID=UPI001C3C66D4|nr:MFS transporter [Staphylococcus chromogenes]MBV5191707.1 MFS transporter [Staphylococcus chromogenes]MBW3132148.1 MFS transporter [Staphylococcus chromogenes]
MNAQLWSKPFIFVTGINFLMYLIHYTLIVTVASYTMAEFHAPESLGGLAAGIFIIGMLLGRLGTGRIIDSLRPKQLIMFGIVFSIVTIGLYFLTQSLTLLLIVRFLHGGAFGIASTATGTYASRIVPDVKKGEGLGYYALSVTMASALGPFLGIVFNQTMGFASIFIMSTLVIIIALGLSFGLTDLPSTLNKEDHERPKGLSAFFQKEALPMSFVIVLVGMAYSSVLSFLTIYAETINLSTAASFFFVVFAIFTFVTRPFTGKTFDYYGPNVIVYPVLVAFALGLVFLSLTHGPVLLYLAAGLIGIGYGTIVPSGQTIVIQQSPKEKMGLATSTFFIFLDFGAGIDPFILGALIPFTGYRMLYLLMAMIGVFAIIGYFFAHGKSASKRHISSSNE